MFQFSINARAIGFLQFHRFLLQLIMIYNISLYTVKHFYLIHLINVLNFSPWAIVFTAKVTGVLILQPYLDNFSVVSVVSIIALSDALPVALP